MSKFLWIKEYKKKIILSILIVTLLNSVGVLVYKKVIYIDYVQSIPNTMLYYQGANVAQIMDSGVEYQLTMPLVADKNMEDNVSVYPLQNKIPLNNLEFNKNTTPALAEDISNKINNNIIELPINASINNTSNWINDTSLHNETLGVDHLINGTYPQTDNEVMIPEVYALYYMEKNDLTSYDEVLNSQIELNTLYDKRMYKVSGIYYGSNTNFIINLPPELAVDEEPTKKQALFLKFNSRNERNQFLENYSQYSFIKSEDFIIQKIRNISIYVFQLLLMCFFIILMYPEIKSYTQKINHYHYSKMNYFWMTLPLLLVFIMIIYGLDAL